MTRTVAKPTPAGPRMPSPDAGGCREAAASQPPGEQRGASRARRPATVPSGQPSWLATTLRGFSSRSHSRMAARYFSGSRLIAFLSSIGSRSYHKGDVLWLVGHVRPPAFAVASPGATVPATDLAGRRRGASWQGFGLAEARRLFEQDEKRCLKRILGILAARNDGRPPRRAAVPQHQRREGRLVPALNVRREQVPVTQHAAVAESELCMASRKSLTEVAIDLSLRTTRNRKPILLASGGSDTRFFAFFHSRGQACQSSPQVATPGGSPSLRPLIVVTDLRPIAAP